MGLKYVCLRSMAHWDRGGSSWAVRSHNFRKANPSTLTAAGRMVMDHTEVMSATVASATVHVSMSQ